MPRHAPGGRLRHRRPLGGHLPEAVGARPRGLRLRPLLQRLLGGVSARHPRRAAHAGRQAERRDGAHRAVE